MCFLQSQRSQIKCSILPVTQLPLRSKYAVYTSDTVHMNRAPKESCGPIRLYPQFSKPQNGFQRSALLRVIGRLINLIEGVKLDHSVKGKPALYVKLDQLWDENITD